MLEGLFFENQYLNSLIILLLFLIGSEIIYFILINYVRRITERTKTELDDVVLGMVSKPIRLFLIIIGLFLAVKTLTLTATYDAWANEAFLVIAILFIAYTGSKILAFFVSHWMKVQKKYSKTPQLINKSITSIIYIVAFLIILDSFGVEITPIIATLGLGGLAVGLALQDTLSNLFAGFHIITDRPINVGDHVEIEGGKSGYVEDIGWRSTRIRMLPNKIVIVPNGKLAESTIINNTLPSLEMSNVIQCGVSYDSDLEKVEKITIAVAKEIQKKVPGALKSHKPFIRYHTFGDSNINFSIILRIEEFVNKYVVTHEFIKALKKAYDKEKIEISWPVRKIYQGEASKPKRKKRR